MTKSDSFTWHSVVLVCFYCRYVRLRLCTVPLCRPWTKEMHRTWTSKANIRLNQEIAIFCHVILFHSIADRFYCWMSLSWFSVVCLSGLVWKLVFSEHLVLPSLVCRTVISDQPSICYFWLIFQQVIILSCSFCKCEPKMLWKQYM